MNKEQIVETIYSESRELIGRQLHYITGANVATVTNVEDDMIRISRDSGEDFTVSRHMVELYASALASGGPVHITTALGDSYSGRSTLEAVVAHMSHVGYIKKGNFSGRKGKHIIWFDTPIKPLGDLRDVAEDWPQLANIEGQVIGRSILNTAITRSLLAKPFLILTGPSGTGKTKGAIDLAKAISDDQSHAVIAVGADWTDNRHVLGYLNPLQTVGGLADGAPIYETTPVLDLILHANDPANRNIPHVLILDEMNLSHVERYFSDSLSAMELDDKEKALKLHAAGAARTRKEEDVQGAIDFPDNLFVIGTVNVDETTYMFSPKVLDRANVIEIHADPTDLEKFLNGEPASKAIGKPRDYNITFLDAARAIREEEENEHVPLLPEIVRKAATKHLMKLFRIMKRGRGEFGFRTGKEVMAYLRTAHFLAGPDIEERNAWAKVANDEDKVNGLWMSALDEQILQKVLPKLHGSRSRLAQLLGALTTYCATGSETAAMEHFPGEDGSNPKRALSNARGQTNVIFKNSYEKLDRMIAILVEEQFVSFIG